MTDVDRSTTPRHDQIRRLAARQWPQDDLARIARKVNAVLAAAGDASLPGEDISTMVHAEAERVFARIEAGYLRLHMRLDGSFEIRKITEHERTKTQQAKGRRR